LLKPSNPTHTYQTRLELDDRTVAMLDACGELFSRVCRTLFADLMAGNKINDLKREYIRRFQITARQFNACRIQVEGMIQSRKEIQLLQIADLKEKIAGLEETIEKLKKKKIHRLKVFRKRRRLNRLKQKLTNHEKDRANGVVRLCFGTRKLFRSQFHLDQAGYPDHASWKKEWQDARNTIFFLLGSKDETAGNQTCAATIQQDDKLTLRLRLPNALHAQYGKYAHIPDLFFNYGHQNILNVLYDCQQRNQLLKEKNPSFKHHGQPISYRFKRDKKGWRLFVSITLEEPAWVTHIQNGVIGVDINTDHLAIVETDRFGNPIDTQNIPLFLYGKNTQQNLAIIGDACATLIDIAHTKQKDIIIEKLDFQTKKANLKALNSRFARTLSSFAYNSIIRTIKSRAFRNGVHIHEVNPAFTSIIGRVKFAGRYGLTDHQAAALCIGRRYLGFSERPPRHQTKVSDGKGCHVAFSEPARNRRKHVWSHWRAIRRKLQAVLVAHFRAAKSRSTDPPMPVHEIESLSDVVGESPARESLATLLG